METLINDCTETTVQPIKNKLSTAIIELDSAGSRSFFSHITDCPSRKGNESSSRKPESLMEIFSDCQLKSKEDFRNAV